MKRIASLLTFLCVFVSVNIANAYTLTEKDTLIVKKATTIIENYIQKKWEFYRTDVIKQLQDFRLKKFSNNERQSAIVGGVIDSLKPKIEVPTLDAGSKVICTELARQGYLPKEIWHADELYAEKFIWKGTLEVYHFWAKPLVRLMRNSQFVTEAVAPYGIAWANHMAYEMGMTQKDNWLGYHIFSTLLPIHEKISSLFISGDNKTVQIEPSTASPSFVDVIRLCSLYLLLLLVVILPIAILYVISVSLKSLSRTIGKFITTRIATRKVPVAFKWQIG